jgi:hypothetical protein
MRNAVTSNFLLLNLCERRPFEARRLQGLYRTLPTPSVVAQNVTQFRHPTGSHTRTAAIKRVATVISIERYRCPKIDR